jgi:tetratricopeptide (TPR) repeat protein
MKRKHAIIEPERGAHVVSPSRNAKEAARVMSQLGARKFEKDEYDCAYSHYMDAYQTLRNEYGDDNIDTSMAAFYTGKCLHCLGRQQAALHFYELFAKSVLENEDRLTEANILNLQSIAWAYYRCRSFRHANSFYQAALLSAFKVLGENHEISAKILNQCGNLHFECGHFNVALRCYKKGLSIEQEIYPDRATNHPDVLVTMHNISHSLEKNGDLLKAFKFLQKTIESFQKGSADTASSRYRKIVADVHLSKARVLSKLGRPTPALEACSQSLEVLRKEFGNDNTDVAATLNEMGIIHANKGDAQLALQNFEESLSIRKKLNDPSKNVSTVLFNLARIHVQNGDDDKAQECFEDLIQHGGS